MDRMLTVDDVARVLSVSRRTAYTYMAQMIHMDSPRRVSEYGLSAWIRARTVDPASNCKGKQKTRQMALKTPITHIPRRREGAG
jgi:predicted DNA-binding transcriptional regulator AlpA